MNSFKMRFPKFDFFSKCDFSFARKQLTIDIHIVKQTQYAYRLSSSTEKLFNAKNIFINYNNECPRWRDLYFGKWITILLLSLRSPKSPHISGKMKNQV